MLFLGNRSSCMVQKSISLSFWPDRENTGETRQDHYLDPDCIYVLQYDRFFCGTDALRSEGTGSRSTEPDRKMGGHTLRRCQDETDLSESEVDTLMAFENLIVGCLWCITIIGIPFGKQFFKMARLSFMPFGANVIG